MRDLSLKATVMSALVVFSAPAFGNPSGAEIHEETVAQIGIYEDPELTTYLDGLLAEIIAVSEMAGAEFTFTLLDSPEINAFATADNYVYVNRGLLNYVANEAQLVSVLAHEVAHVTQRHVDWMPTAAGSAKFLSWLAGALSGSNDVFLAGMAYANSLLKGHGRDKELEADETAARYMVALGYDPQEMLAMLSTMKDLETQMKDRAARSGAPRRTYHGIFSTHPRNDTRLRSAVSKAQTGDAPPSRDAGNDRYRQATEGLVWGENFKEKEAKAERYSDRALRVRVDFPEGWTHGKDDQTNVVTGQPADSAARLSIQPHPRTTQTPEEYLYNHLNIGPLQDGREISPARLKGYTGVLRGADGAPDQRIAVVYYKLNAYLFTGAVVQAEDFDDYDALFLESIDTFRPISNREVEGQKPRRIHYVKATGATTFEALGEHLGLDAMEVEDLRLINGHYPDGQPRAGDWIRIFRR